jgi:hypothetical protein
MGRRAKKTVATSQTGETSSQNAELMSSRDEAPPQEREAALQKERTNAPSGEPTSRFDDTSPHTDETNSGE